MKNSLVDIEINVKIKLALFWVALMFFYIYNDLLSMFKPGTVEELVAIVQFPNNWGRDLNSVLPVKNQVLLL